MIKAIVFDKEEAWPRMDKGEFHECFAKPHSSRPGVQWLVWVNKK